MESKALRTVSFILTTLAALCAVGITYFIMDGQPLAYMKKGPEAYSIALVILIAFMPVCTFILRSISNGSWAWILGGIIAYASLSLWLLEGYHYYIYAGIYVLCLLGMFVPAISGEGRDCHSGCDCNCDTPTCGMGECF